MRTPFHNVKTDPLSFCVTPVDLLFQEARFSHGTGFIWKRNSKYYVITNWHNFTGINPFTKEHLNPSGRLPDAITVSPSTADQRDDGNIELLRHPIRLRLYEHFEEPFWVQHKDFAENRADIAILELPASHLVYQHVNQIDYKPLFTHIGADVLIAGYPFSNYEGLLFPIWKRGSIASEPAFGWQGKPAFLIDAATRRGMSGSPVFRRVFGPAASPNSEGDYIIEPGNVMTSEFIGVYAGHMIRMHK